MKPGHALLRRTPLSVAVAAALAAVPAMAQDEAPVSMEAPTVEVIGITPLPGLGVPRNEIPANVQAATEKDIERVQAINLPDFLNQAAPSLNVNEIQNNPYQPQVNYRGFTASPLLGEPQGLSVYQDGVRVNEPFGDVVNWDLIPQNAIANINIIPGSNPLFGLNTLGGALSVRTKSGAYFPNTDISAYGGSWGRWSVQAEHGGYSGNTDYFVAGTWFEEDGWRDFSPSEVGQLFGKFGWEDARTDLDFSITLADTDLTGNGVLPESMLEQRRDQIFTKPDNTQNKMYMFNLSGSHYVTDNQLLSGTAYYRHLRARTLNGDANDDFEDSVNDGACDPDDFSDPTEIADCEAAVAAGGFDEDTAVNNRTRTDSDGYGLGLQYAFFQERNRLTLGASFDEGKADFEQSSEGGVFDADRGVIVTDESELQNSLEGRTRTWSLFITDTFNITPQLLLTLSGRYNNTNVKTTDRLTLTPPNLDGDHDYDKFNPAIGLNWNPSEAFNTWAGWSQGNRAPSPIELGCADPDNPCTLPNALASDPFLEQVVAQTFELGVRGRLANGLGWSAAAYRTNLKDDILFVSTGTSAGFFTNFGETRRQGLELGLSGDMGRFRWYANYAWVDATFESGACLLSENNSSRGTSAQCASDDEIFVSPGDTIPGIPEHQFNIGLDFQATERWSIGMTARAFSDQFARGNENNRHQPGTFTDNFGETRTFEGSGEVDGFVVVNLTTRFRLAPRWEIFARVDNVFDEDYSTGAILAENPFNAAGTFQTNSEDWRRETFFAPGAPRAGWVGIRYVIERKPQR
jgi:outer membrane receptor protein involved in Fe transport